MQQTGHDVVVIGGSAGAIAPLRTLLSQLPAELSASVFVALHVPPRGYGVLRSITATISHLPVRQAEDGMTIQPGHIYLAVPGCHLLLAETGVIRLGRGPRENMARPAIDALFRSAAVAYGPRVVGVLLSGMLNDGVAGLEAIKRCGGYTVVQDPQDAVAAEMPRNALRKVSIDVTASTARLAEVVMELVTEPASSAMDVPNDLRMEVEIAAGHHIDSDLVRDFADPVPLTCPSCGGVMSKLRNGKLLRFRCQVGHAMSAEVMAKEQENAVDEALRVALRVIEERAELVARLADDNRRSERMAAAHMYDQRVAEYRNYADVLRHALILSMESTSTASASAQDMDE
jgi:two-component system chemotaxis response regulator CheB